eukprot:CAMPEP_0167787266 /NCGR_PEP_ID=MMETSP0111_2-20121227/9307_1 /TAXON_ID=91324 /ORGANISM="Lotharella globosa, Strain CCCM811" /LENGTH=391 /DNA_ID=CAMNT_0007678849 /DNA_START=407 /DNA_END=1582 /DNA_ORIENTATION=+
MMERLDTVVTLIGYMATSTTMSIANKMALSVIGTPLILVAIQSLAVLLLLIPAYKTISLGSSRDRLRWLPVSVLFIAMLVTSMISYNYCSLGTLVIIHMGAPIVAFLVETAVSSTFQGSLHTFASLAVIAVGVVTYAIFQKTVGTNEFFGVIAAVANMGIGTTEHVAQRILLVETKGFGMSDTGIMLYNSVVSCIGAFLLSFPFGEMDTLTSRIAQSPIEPIGYAYIAISCLCAPCIGYMAIRAQRRISATSFLVVTNLDKIVVVTFGILVLGESYEPLAAAGAAVAVLGGLYFSWARHRLPSKKDDGEDDDDEEEEQESLLRYKEEATKIETEPFLKKQNRRRAMQAAVKAHARRAAAASHRDLERVVSEPSIVRRQRSATEIIVEGGSL